ncbi:hypothetical protein Y695_02949 [Hydrogenophaga sp. T4]|nr:hypothetical protein Y695_02949 [Hydrogenophaga sp. T4]
MRSAFQGPRPLVRRIVYSEVCANRASTAIVPMSTEMGSSSYTRLGISSPT